MTTFTDKKVSLLATINSSSLKDEQKNELIKTLSACKSNKSIDELSVLFDQFCSEVKQVIETANSASTDLMLEQQYKDAAQVIKIANTQVNDTLASILNDFNAAISSSVIAQSAIITEASNSNAVKVLQNTKARIKLCESFAQLNDKTITLIAEHAIKNDIDLAELTNYQNYKTSARIAQRACYLTDSALDSRTIANLKLFDNELKRLAKSFDSFSFAAIASKTKITESMLKNIIKSAQFFNLVERSDKRSIKDTIKSDTAYKLVTDSK